MAAGSEITALLTDARAGSASALDDLLRLSFPSLRAMAAKFLSHERSGITLQPTDLVQETMLRLFVGQQVHVQNRAHLMAIAGRQMRQLLVDHAREKMAQRRGGGASRVDDAEIELSDESARELQSFLILDDLIEQLRSFDERAAQVVEMRFFAGLSREEVAEQLGITVRTVQRDWEVARAWLLTALTGS